MSNISKQTRQASINRNEMQRSWEAAEWLIRGKVEQLDYLLYKVYSEARTLGVEGCYIREFVKDGQHDKRSCRGTRVRRTAGRKSTKEN